jgi:hypothetical protein
MLAVMRTLIPIVVISLVVAGCIKPDNERYVTGRPDIDQKTREAILQHRVILGMFPDEAAAAAGQFAYAVKVDKAWWGENYDTLQVIYAQRGHPDNSEIELNFWTSTQFDTTNVVGFKVVFEHGRAVSISRTHNKEEDARLSQAEATRIVQEAAVKHGYRLEAYRKATANYALMRDGAWMAFFECKAPIPDKDFTVWIDDRTGEARVESREQRQ